MRPDAGTVSIFGTDALLDPVGAKRITAWVSDEPMIYDKLTPMEYLVFVAGLWGVPPRHAEAMHRLEAERLEDQHVERALDHVGAGAGFVHETITILPPLILIVKM